MKREMISFDKTQKADLRKSYQFVFSKRDVGSAASPSGICFLFSAGLSRMMAQSGTAAQFPHSETRHFARPRVLPREQHVWANQDMSLLTSFAFLARNFKTLFTGKQMRSEQKQSLFEHSQPSYFSLKKSTQSGVTLTLKIE